MTDPVETAGSLPPDAYWGGYTEHGELLHLVVASKEGTLRSACGRLLAEAREIPESLQCAKCSPCAHAAGPVETAAPERDVTIAITELSLSMLPEDHVDFDLFAVWVQRRPGDRWAVMLRGKFLLHRDGGWHLRPIPKSAIDDYRYEYEDAIRRAREALPLIEVNDRRALDVLNERGTCPGDPDPAEICARCGGSGLVSLSGRGSDGPDPCPDCGPEATDGV